MVLETKQLTVDEFDQLVLLPENADRALEYIGGKIVEVLSNSDSSEIGSAFNAMIFNFVRQHNLGRVTGADGGYVVSGERYMPDVAFMRRERQPTRPSVAWNPLAPDLAVEVLSPSNEPTDMRIKVVNYLRAGTTVWVVDPDRKIVEVYVPNEAPKKLGVEAVLDGGAVLPGFSLPVGDIFALGAE